MGAATSSGTVPVFAPDGSLGDIPAENLPAAVKAGYKPGVTMKSQDGSTGVVPADRVPDAAKGGLQIVPLKDQETQHPGFWHSLGSDLMAMLPDFKQNANSAPDMSGRVGAATKLNEQQKSDLSAEDANRKAAGYSAPYRAIAPIAEGLGVNVPGMEESAKEGDVAGVAGHAAAVPTAMAATAGVAKGAGVVADVAPAAKASLRAVSTAARNVGDSVNPDVVGMFSPRAAHSLRVLQKIGAVADTIAQAKPEQLAPELTTPARTLPGQISPETTSVRYGPEEMPPSTAALGPEQQKLLPPAPRGAELAELPTPKPVLPGQSLATKPTTIDLTKSPEAAAVMRFSKADIKAASDLLHSATSDLVDETIPPDKNYGANLATKSRVEFYLQRGDVANAEKSLDAGAKQANPAWQPLDRQPVPSTNEIRERIQREATAPKPGTWKDAEDDQAVNQELQWSLERHGWSAESEARREFIARNSTGMTKGELAKRYAAGSGKAAPAAAPATPDDLTEVLQKSLDAARARSQAK